VTDRATLERRVGVSLIALALGAGIGLGARKLADRDHHHKATPAATTTMPRGPRPLHPGRYTSQRLRAVKYFTVSSGWQLNIDHPAILEISRHAAPLGSIGFDLPVEVFDSFVTGARAITAPSRPLPADLGAFFRSRSEVDTSASRPTTVDGIAAESFVVRLKPLPPETAPLCGVTRCMVYARSGTQPFGLFENDATEFTVLHVGKQTLVIAVAAPVSTLAEFLPVAHKVLATVRLRQR
jgi:hypothetical protein